MFSILNSLNISNLITVSTQNSTLIAICLSRKNSALHRLICMDIKMTVNQKLSTRGCQRMDKSTVNAWMKVSSACLFHISMRNYCNLSVQRFFFWRRQIAIIGLVPMSFLI